jgi:GMP synthase (glutamine-hydrolysing)
MIWDIHLKRWLGEFLEVIFGKPAAAKSTARLSA